MKCGYSRKKKRCLFKFIKGYGWSKDSGNGALKHRVKYVVKKDVKEYCGWPLCQKEIEKNDGKKTKCKGCKLIKYCSRNHQKKHWSYIHRQQCLKMKNRE